MPPYDAWGTTDEGAIFYWNEQYAEDLAADGCAGSGTPLIIEKDGVYFVSCTSTGIIYAPPLSLAALTELLFPDEWSILPPG